MQFLKKCYEKIFKKPAPYWFRKSFWRLFSGRFRKWFSNSLASNCPFSGLRILLYRMSGFHIGKGTFIGMHCYLDDLCYEWMTIGNNVTISYGVYFACHGKNQPDYPIVVKDGAYIGMRASVISKNADGGTNGVTIGENAVVGACTLVNRDVPDGATAVGVPCRIIPPKTTGSPDTSKEG